MSRHNGETRCPLSSLPVLCRYARASLQILAAAAAAAREREALEWGRKYEIRARTSRLHLD